MLLHPELFDFKFQSDSINTSKTLNSDVITSVQL